MKTHFNTLLIATAVVLSALLFSQAFLNRNKSADTISVTGLGSKDFIADLIVWKGSFRQKNLDLKEAYAQLDRDREKIRGYLVGKGVDAKNIVFSAIDINREFDEQYDGNGNRISSTFTGYRLNQDVQVESRDVDKVELISREVSELINSGIEFYSQAPEYYYTRLAELKIEMIAAATRDARIRAEKIAEQAGSDL
ncbi:MAG: SIMPL domain-containing protein [Bacteroidota bacterium]